MTGNGVADVVIIGAGVVGTAIARTIAGYQLSCVLVDAAGDVVTGTTKSNTAILHTGFDTVPGSLESRLLRRGSGLLHDYARRAGIPVERTGALVVDRRAGVRPARDRGQGPPQRLHRRPQDHGRRPVPGRAAAGPRRPGRHRDSR